MGVGRSGAGIELRFLSSDLTMLRGCGTVSAMFTKTFSRWTLSAPGQ